LLGEANCGFSEKLFREGAKSGEFSFYPLETKKSTFLLNM